MSFSFDRIAPYYDLLACLGFQGSIQRSQRHWLGEIPGGSKVLFLGGGTGLLLSDLLQGQQAAHITYVEASAAMLLRAKHRVTRYQQKHPQRKIPTFTFVHGSENEIPEHGEYQVVITNFVCDMYSNQNLFLLLERIHRQLTDEARWLFTDFRISPHRIRRLWQKPLLRLMFWFFRLTAGISAQQLPDYAQCFQALGWKMTREQSFFGDFIVSRVYRKTSELARGVALSGR